MKETFEKTGKAALEGKTGIEDDDLEQVAGGRPASLKKYVPYTDLIRKELEKRGYSEEAIQEAIDEYNRYTSQ